MAYNKRSRQTFEADVQKAASPFVVYGTPLPPLDENTRDDGSFVPVWQQEVTDERGRKRLHGAFTGGFSAGYFNTVGSKEGWTPATFVSSRQNRAKDAKNKPQQRPEDFMDEDDIREAEESQTLNTSKEFSGFGTEHDVLRQSAAIDLFRPLDETMGTKLLKKMGWREGSGIGPRVRRAAKSDECDATTETHLFAPDDVQVDALIRKKDTKGLGYSAELQSGKPSTSQAKTAARKVVPSTASSEDEDDAHFAAMKPMKPKKKTGFGVGILNDDGSDDDDPYSMGPKISYNKTIGGDKQPKIKTKKPVTSANPLLKHKPTFISKKLANLRGVLRKCHDGRLPVDGFVLADELDSFGTMSLQDEKYKPPAIPEDWKSSITPQGDNDNAAEFFSTAEAAKSSSMTAKSRASLLGEAPLPGKSVFDFLSPAARDRLATATGRQNLPAAGNEIISPSNDPPGTASHIFHDKTPVLDKETAQQALARGSTGWMPYAEDPPKRQRYKTYLEVQAGILPTSSLPAPSHAFQQTKKQEEDLLLELQEFARAAQVFKPISGLMASRFTSSTTSTPQPSTTQTGDASLDTLLTKPSTKPKDPAEEAARMGMFGPLTRTFVNFHPNRLLCKRFGVDMPVVHSAPTATADASDKSAAPPQDAPMQFKSFASAGFQHDEKAEVEQRAEPQVALVPGLVGKQKDVPVDVETNDALEQERPGMAVFKAIFGDDDSGDD